MKALGIDHYIKAGKSAVEWHAENIKKMKQLKFDTIAVHGIYSMQEALDYNQECWNPCI